jgi:hypothetical protein
VTKIFYAGIAQRSKHYWGHGFLYPQRFRSATEQNQSTAYDACPDCRYGNGRSVNPLRDCFTIYYHAFGDRAQMDQVSSKPLR